MVRCASSLNRPVPKCIAQVTEIGDAIHLSASPSKAQVVAISVVAAATGYGVGVWLGYTPELNCNQKSIQKILRDQDFWKTYVGKSLP